MTILGAGLAVAGTSFLGYGANVYSAPPASNVLPDINTGITQQGRLLNPATGDYTFTSDGRLCGEALVPQLVKLAMLTVYNTAIVPMGVDLTGVQMKRTTFKRDVSLAVSNALANLVGQNLVKINTITVWDIPQDAAVGVVAWTDLTTDIQYTNNIGAQ